MTIHRRLLAGLCLVSALFVVSGSCFAEGKASLRARYQALLPALEENAFGVPLHMQSEDVSSRVSSEVHGVLHQPYETFRAALRSPAGWCQLVTLHAYLRGCTLESNQSPAALTIYHGGRKPVPLEDARRSHYAWERQVDEPDYFKVVMRSDGGLVGTSDYQLTLEAIPLDGGRVFARVAFSFRYSMITRMLTATYFAFVRGRPGFSVVDYQEDGEPVLVTGRVAALERNVMRFYLALQAFLEGTSQPEAERDEWRWQRWFALTMQYPRQLYDMEESVYLESKRRNRQYVAVGPVD
jgi:hypothetical protein